MRTSGKLVIETGEHFLKIFKFRKNNGVDPVDFTDAEDISFSFEKADRTWLTLTSEGEAPKVTVENDPILGNLSVELDEEDSTLLRTGEGLNIEVAWVIDGKKTIVILEKVLDVRPTRSA